MIVRDSPPGADGRDERCAVSPAHLVPDVPTVLAVDDEEAYLRFLSVLLRGQGCRVVTTTEGARAIELARAEPPDLLLLDLNLGGSDGLAVCREIKGDPRTSHVPVIAVTGMTDNGTLMASLESGVDEFLSKPIAPAELLLRVRNILRLRQAEGLRTSNRLLARHQAELECKNRELEATVQEVRRVQSEHRLAEDQREQLRERLVRMERTEMVGKIAAGVAHEVRNPLHAILSLTEAICARAGNDEEFGPLQEHLRAQVGRLAVLMHDLLDFGKPLDPVHLRPVNAAEILAEVGGLWISNPHSLSHRLLVDGRVEGGSLVVQGDLGKLTQAVLNLLENGAEHSPEGAPLTLRVGSPRTGVLLVEVGDLGSGVPEGALGRVFEPFFTTRRRGTGLGLSIVQRIVEDHGGCVRLVQNPAGAGTVAQIELPLSGAGAL